MKKLNLLLVLLIGLSSSAFSQHPAIESFFKKYENTQRVDNSKIETEVLKMVERMKEDQNSDHQITHYRVLNCTTASPVKKEDILSLFRSLRQDDFEDLVQINADGEAANIMVKTNNAQDITNFFLILREPDEFLLVNLEGLMDFNDFIDTDFNFGWR